MNEKLTARAVDHAGVDTHGDGHALRVVSAERGLWVFRYQPRGAAREIGLGADLNVSLAAARENAQAPRKPLAADIDPFDQRKAARLAEATMQARATTFAQSVNAYLEAHKARWRNAEHAAQWGSTIKAYATQRSAGWRAAPGQPTTFTKSLDQSGRRSRKPRRGRITGRRLESCARWWRSRAAQGLCSSGATKGVRMSDMSLTAVLRRLGDGDLTAHGFRSTFRDQAAEATVHPNHVVEQTPAHAIGSVVEAAYPRGILIANRQMLVGDWSNYLAALATQVVRPRFGEQRPTHEVVA